MEWEKKMRITKNNALNRGEWGYKSVFHNLIHVKYYYKRRIQKWGLWPCFTGFSPLRLWGHISNPYQKYVTKIAPPLMKCRDEPLQFFNSFRRSTNVGSYPCHISHNFSWLIFLIMFFLFHFILSWFIYMICLADVSQQGVSTIYNINSLPELQESGLLDQVPRNLFGLTEIFRTILV